jgi:hypothetical protein
MLKEMDKTSEIRMPDKGSLDLVLVQIRWDDFQQQEGGFWVATRDITINGTGGTDRLIKAGREFKRGELSMIGIDLASLLEKHLTDSGSSTV